MSPPFDPVAELPNATETERWRQAGAFRWQIDVEIRPAHPDYLVPPFRAHARALQQKRPDGTVLRYDGLSNIFTRSGSTAEDAVTRCDGAVRYWIEQYRYFEATMD